MKASSKKVLIRLPASLHRQLVKQADADGVSFNTHAIRCLDDARQRFAVAIVRIKSAT